MSKNYNKYYKHEDEREETPITEETAAPIAEETQTEEVKEVPTEDEEERPIAPPKVTKIFAIVTGPKKVNMRFKPNKSGQVINILPPKARVTVIDDSKPEWWKVSYKGITGYMMSQFLKKE